MPTPRDSTDALPLERERSTHTTCPPEDDRPGQWRVEVLDRLGRAALDSPYDSGELRQQEGSSVEAESPGPLEVTTDRAENKTSEHAHLMEPAEPSPLMGTSPSSSHVDDKEVEQIQPSAPTSSALDLQYSIRYGIDSTRVCGTVTYTSKTTPLMPVLADPDPHLLDASRWK